MTAATQQPDWIAALLAWLRPARQTGPLVECRRCGEAAEAYDETTCLDCFTAEW